MWRPFTAWCDLQFSEVAKALTAFDSDSKGLPTSLSLETLKRAPTRLRSMTAWRRSRGRCARSAPAPPGTGGSTRSATAACQTEWWSGIWRECSWCHPWSYLQAGPSRPNCINLFFLRSPRPPTPFLHDWHGPARHERTGSRAPILYMYTSFRRGGDQEGVRKSDHRGTVISISLCTYCLFA